MKYAPAILRLVLGLMMALLGANIFLNFIPAPTEPPPPQALSFAQGLEGSGYLFPLMGAIYLISALLLFLDRAVGLALVLLAPIAVNAFLFHAVLGVPGIVPSIIFNALIAGLAWFYRDRFAGLFK